MSPLATRLLEENKRLYYEAASPLKSHGPDHHLRVYQAACALAARLGVEYDDDILAGAALFHDLAAYYPEKTGDQYHNFDDKLARPVLEAAGFPKEKLDRAINAIAHHGSDPKFKQQDEMIETTLLRDADKLDAFGAIGVARIVMVRTLNGDTLEDIVDGFWTRGHLEQKWQSISTDAAREMAREDYEYSRAFFCGLASKLARDNTTVQGEG